MIPWGPFRHSISLFYHQLISNFNFICHLKSPVPWKLTRAQVLGVRTQTSLGTIILLTTVGHKPAGSERVCA